MYNQQNDFESNQSRCIQQTAHAYFFNHVADRTEWNASYGYYNSSDLARDIRGVVLHVSSSFVSRTNASESNESKVDGRPKENELLSLVVGMW